MNPDLFNDVIVFADEYYRDWRYVYPISRPEGVIQRLWHLRWGGVILAAREYDPALTEAEAVMLQEMPQEVVTSSTKEEFRFITTEYDPDTPGILWFVRYEDFFWIIPEELVPQRITQS